MSNHSTRGHLRTLLAIFAIATLLAMPFSAIASNRPALKAEVTELVSAVSEGELLAIEAKFDNVSNSNLQHFRFEGSFFDQATAPKLVDVYKSLGECGTIGATSVSCEFGTLPAKTPVVLTLVFEAPTGVAWAPSDTVRELILTFTGTFSSDSTTKGKPSGSNRDAWSDDATVVLGGRADFFGAWQPSHSGTESFGPFGAGQRTALTVDGTHLSWYTVQMKHISGGIDCVGVGSIWGSTVDLQVADGEDAPLAVIITYEKLAGLNPQQIRFVHDKGGGNCEPIPSAANCDTDFAGDYCFRAYWFGTGGNQRVQAYVKLPYNGRLGGF